MVNGGISYGAAPNERKGKITKYGHGLIIDATLFAVAFGAFCSVCYLGNNILKRKEKESLLERVLPRVESLDGKRGISQEDQAVYFNLAGKENSFNIKSKKENIDFEAEPIIDLRKFLENYRDRHGDKSLYIKE